MRHLALLFSASAVVLLALALPAVTRPAGAAEAPGHVAAFDLAALPGGQFDKGWSAPADEGGTACRKALRGKTAAVRVKAWWKDGDLRPAEGEKFTVEVKYKDTLAKPARFLAHGGIGWKFGLTPLHRFGGANDGQWKTANIPLPWDMVARLVSTLDPRRNAPMMTEFVIRAAADLPVASLTVRKAAPADEPRFYAECRAQIAAEQKDKRAKTPMPAVKNPPAVKGPIGAFPWEASCRLFPNCAGVPGKMGKPVKVRMCIGQLESGSFGVYANGAALTGVDYEVTPLTDAAGKTLKATVECRTAEYSLLDGQWSPVRLWPAYAVDIEPNHSQWFLFNVETKRGVSAAGLYKGKILITAKEAKAELPLEVEVLPVDLLTMDETGVTMFGCYEKLPAMHDIEFQRRYNYGGALLWYHTFVPPVAWRDGKIVFDFTYPDDWMKGCRKRGFTGAIWYLGGDAAGLPGTLSAWRHIGTLDGKMSVGAWLKAQNGVGHVLPKTRTRFIEWMRTLNAHAVSSGWLELFPTPHDEPQKWIRKGVWVKSFFKDACAAIREADPRIRVYGCIHRAKAGGIADFWKVFIDDIDVYCTNSVWEDADIGSKVRAAGAESKATGGRGKLFWQYTTRLGAGVPGSLRFFYGFFYGACGCTGCTAWAYNWGDDTWDLSGRKGAMAVTAWPTACQTIPTPWFEGQREGLDDRRLIATYQKKFAGDAEAMKVLNKVLDEARDRRLQDLLERPSIRPKGSGNSIEAGFIDSIEHTAKLIRWRNTLLDKLAGAKP